MTEEKDPAYNHLTHLYQQAKGEGNGKDNGNYENVFLCVLTLVLFTLPALVERQLRVDLPDTLEIIILLSVFEGQPEGYGHHGLQLCDAGPCHDQHAGAGDGYRRRHHRPL